jgi:hypothetical protein
MLGLVCKIHSLKLLLVALAAASVCIGGTMAQEKKEKAQRKAAAKENSAPASKGSGWPPCAGGTFWSDLNSQCSLPDGRVCTVVVDSSSARLKDCR